MMLQAGIFIILIRLDEGSTTFNMKTTILAPTTEQLEKSCTTCGWRSGVVGQMGR